MEYIHADLNYGIGTAYESLEQKVPEAEKRQSSNLDNFLDWLEQKQHDDSEPKKKFLWDDEPKGAE